MGNVTAEWHNIWAHSVCWADMRNHLSGLWLSLVYSWKTISKYFVFFTRLFFVPQDEPSPPRPEAYPIPTQTYPREYFTIPASKSQDRVVGPGQQGPPPHWQGMEDRDRLPMGDNIHNNSMQVRKLEILFRYCFSGRYNALRPKKISKVLLFINVFFQITFWWHRNVWSHQLVDKPIIISFSILFWLWAPLIFVLPVLSIVCSISYESPWLYLHMQRLKKCHRIEKHI